jgi:hypothetical protein
MPTELRGAKAGVVALVAAAFCVIAATPAAAQPTPAGPGPAPAPTPGELPDATPGVQSISTPDGDTFFFLPVDKGRRWFPFCPAGDPPDKATDVCGGTGTGDKVYNGRTFFADPDDSRCTVVAAHNDTTRPSDVVLPRKCYRLPLMFGVASTAMLDGVAESLRQAIGSCAGPGPQPAGRCGNPLTRWPRRGLTGPVDCPHVVPAELPAEVAAYTGGGQDPSRLGQVCAVLDAYLTGPADPPPPTAAALALGPSTVDLYGNGGGNAPTQRQLDLGLFTVNLTEACANGSSIACGLDKAGAALDCASDPMGCLSRWLATGATSVVRLLGDVIAAPPPVDLTDPAFRSVYQPLGVTSAYLALLLLLVSGIASAARLDYAGIGHAVLGVFRYALGLVTLLTLTAMALDLAHTLSVGIAGDESSLQALTTRFQQAIQNSLGSGGAASSAFAAVLSVLMLLAAAFTWLIMNGRKAGILIICAFSPILLAGQAGPKWAQAWTPRALKMLAAIIFAQPVAAVFYRFGVGLMSLSPGPGNVVTGLIILLLVGFAPWLLLAFIGITTQLLANEQTRARGGHGGGGLTAASIAAATIRSNAPPRAAAAGPAALPTGAEPAGTSGGGGFRNAAATGVLAASAAQQLAGHIGEQVTTAGGATGDAPRGPQLAHAASLGAIRQRAATPPASAQPAASSAAQRPQGPASGATPTPTGAPQAATAIPRDPRPTPPPPPPPPDPEPEPLAAREAPQAGRA